MLASGGMLKLRAFTRPSTDILHLSFKAPTLYCCVDKIAWSINRLIRGGYLAVNRYINWKELYYLIMCNKCNIEC